MTNGPKSFAVEMPFSGMTSASGQPAFLPADSLNPNYIPAFNFFLVLMTFLPNYSLLEMKVYKGAIAPPSNNLAGVDFQSLGL